MNAPTVDPATRARKMEALVLRMCTREATQAAIAVSMGVSESTVSRLLSTGLTQFCQLLAYSGLKVIGQDMKAYPEDYVQALHVMASMQIQATSPAKLVFEDSE